MSKLFGVQPAKRKPGYANFSIDSPPLKLVLLENPGHGGTINHLGVQVESSTHVHAEITRLTEAGMFTEEEIGTTCCFATQDKVWVAAPDREKCGLRRHLPLLPRETLRELGPTRPGRPAD
ncbi:ArsI/CadI family heavy metal resistance metalloenzyme [Mycobacteroides salmoniphilum]|uniref:ArsI/CadI family heavy metal resistance metalloenzyme n=1 Tax=Mycobacteroides salmoniphilum TaxID=404941 RepID=UPI003985823C